MIVPSSNLLSHRSFIVDAWRPPTHGLLKGDTSCYDPSRRVAMTSSNRPNHYGGPPNPRNYALAGAVGNAYSQTDQNEKSSSQYAGCPSAQCKYPGSSGAPCNVLINCDSTPQHFRVVHGIHDMNRSTRTTCAWVGCGQPTSRNNFPRHIREVHLGHDRNSGH